MILPGKTKIYAVGALVLFACLPLTSLKAQETRVKKAESAEKSVPAEPQTIDVIKVDSNLVSVPVIVSDREGRYVPNLTVERFKLFDNSSEQKITYFDAAEEPLNVAIMLDTSRSTEGVLDDIKKAAKNFLKELRPQDRALIVSFDYEVQVLSPLTSDRKVLEDSIRKARVGERFGTTLNDAVSEIANKEFKAVTGRKAMILLSDGEDAGSVTPTDELLNDESESDTMVYSIHYQSEFRGRGGFPRFPDRRGRGGGRGGILFPRRFGSATGQRPLPGQRGMRRMRGSDFLYELSQVTSGRFYEGEVTDLKKTFSQIADELRHQYRLGFYPDELQKDGSVHQLRVKVSDTDVAVRSRQQYRAQK